MLKDLVELTLTIIIAAILGAITGYITYYIEELFKRRKLEKERMWNELKRK